ncbi:MAG: HEAT repeat domain-containing protein [Myxococcales bacterium]|nr:HEAT repeat domain-containing protein [Myxococcales bacterium]
MALVAGGAIAVAFWPGQRPTARVTVEHAPGPTQPARAVEGATRAPLAPQRSRADRYALDYTLQFTAPAPKSGETTADLKFAGILALGEPVERDGGRWLGARIEGARLDRNAAARAVTQFTASAADLEQPWLMELDGEGRVTGTRFAEGTSQGARALLATVAAAIQFVQPQGSNAKAWEAVERDVNGAYSARYETEAGGAVRKTWTAGLLDDLAGASHAPGYRVQTDATFDRVDGRLRALRFDQSGTVGVGLAGGDKRARFSTRLRLDWQAAAQVTWPGDLDPAALPRFDAVAAAGRLQTPQVVATLQELLDQARLAADRKSTADRSRVADDLARKLRDDPRQVTEIEAMLRKGMDHDGVERTLVEGLVRAGSAAAQASLIGLARDTTLRPALRDRVLQGAVFVQRPDEAFTRGLEDLAFDSRQAQFAAHAAITLGAAVQRLRATSPQQASAAAQKMADHAAPHVTPGPVSGTTAKAAPSTGELADWIAALGNTAAPEVLPVLLAALKDPRERMRRSAALALRWQAPNAVLPALTEAMRTDDSIHVRDHLMQAAKYLGPETMLAVVEKALFHDGSPYVRLAAAHTVAVWALEAPGLDDKLKQALALEPSSKVRESLKNYLEAGRVAPPFRKVADGGAKQGGKKP